MELDHRTSPTLTEFGKHLYNVMFSRNLRTFAEVSRLLEANDAHFSRQAISNYASGKRAVPWPFIEELVDALKLNDKEQKELAWYFTYGQKRAG